MRSENKNKVQGQTASFVAKSDAKPSKWKHVILLGSFIRLYNSGSDLYVKEVSAVLSI